MDNNWQIPDGVAPDIQKKIVENSIKERQLKNEAGWLGKFWGTKHAAQNIVGIVCLSSIILLFVIILLPLDIDADIRNRLIQTASSLITLGLGYLFGAHTKTKE